MGRPRPAGQRAVLSELQAALELGGSLTEDYDGKLEPLPDAPPEFQTRTLKPLHVSSQSIFAKLPAHPYPPGYVAIVWLKDGERLSNPVVVNQPDTWFLLKTTCRPGEMNRLCGSNLRGDRYVPRSSFARIHL